MFIQVLSIVGALLMLGAFAALQLKRLDADSITYQLMNFFGGTFLCIAAITVRQAGLILIEGAWALISFAALIRVMRARRSGAIS